MKRKTAIFALWAMATTGVMVSGCATSSGGVTNNAPEQKLLVQYSDPAFEEALNQAGLKSPLTEYWQSHGTRDWKRRYELEKFPKPVEEKFYVAYYANAWTIRSVLVTAVNLTTQTPSVDIALTIVDPEKKKDTLHSLKDMWELTDGTWRHIVQDPMLSGFAQ